MTYIEEAKNKWKDDKDYIATYAKVANKHVKVGEKNI